MDVFLSFCSAIEDGLNSVYNISYSLTVAKNKPEAMMQRSKNGCFPVLDRNVGEDVCTSVWRGKFSMLARQDVLQETRSFGFMCPRLHGGGKSRTPLYYSTAYLEETTYTAASKAPKRLFSNSHNNSHIELRNPRVIRFALLFACYAAR